jgi:hypothetical protein
MTKFRSHPDVLSRKVGDKIVLVHMGRNEIFSLNATGSRLWELLSEGRSRSDAVEQMQVEFDASRETIESETDHLLALLEREGLAAIDTVG